MREKNFGIQTLAFKSQMIYVLVLKPPGNDCVKKWLLPLNWSSLEQVHFIWLTDTLHGGKIYFTQWYNKVSRLTKLMCPSVLESVLFLFFNEKKI